MLDVFEFVKIKSWQINGNSSYCSDTTIVKHFFSLHCKNQMSYEPTFRCSMSEYGIPLTERKRECDQSCEVSIRFWDNIFLLNNFLFVYEFICMYLVWNGNILYSDLKKTNQLLSVYLSVLWILFSIHSNYISLFFVWICLIRIKGNIHGLKTGVMWGIKLCFSYLKNFKDRKFE